MTNYDCLVLLFTALLITLAHYHCRHIISGLLLYLNTFLCYSGLDTVTASHTLKLLSTLAHQGRTIVCTIHQPSASLFKLFDHVYVLAAGLCVYQGPSGELVSFLANSGLTCPTHYNPADYSEYIVTDITT